MNLSKTMLHIKRVVGGRLVTRSVDESSPLTAPEAAAFLGCDLRWVYALIARRRLPARKPHGRLLIPARAVLGYAATRRKGKHADEAGDGGTDRRTGG